jgi:hypothetical protein
MSQLFTSDDEPHREERADLGEGVYLSFYSNWLRQATQDQGSSMFLALEMHKRDHLDTSLQQNRFARIISVATVVGFLMIMANIIVMTEIDSLTTRIVLGGASALALSLVYFFRSTIMQVNRELLAERKDIRASTSQIAERERERQVEMIRPFLSNNTDSAQMLWKPQHR